MIRVRRHLAASLVGLSAVLAAACGEKPMVADQAPTAVGVESAAVAPEPPPSTIAVAVGNASFEAELALTAAQRNIGLSGRDSIPERSGMLFVLGTERVSSIWMKGMRFPLDIIWVSEDCRVVDLVREAPHPDPQAPDDVATYTASVPAAYVLEVNGGEARRYAVDTGDRVQISNVPSDAGGGPLFATRCGT